MPLERENGRLFPAEIRYRIIDFESQYAQSAFDIENDEEAARYANEAIDYAVKYGLGEDYGGSPATRDHVTDRLCHTAIEHQKYAIAFDLAARIRRRSMKCLRMLEIADACQTMRPQLARTAVENCIQTATGIHDVLSKIEILCKTVRRHAGLLDPETTRLELASAEGLCYSTDILAERARYLLQVSSAYRECGFPEEAVKLESEALKTITSIVNTPDSNNDNIDLALLCDTLQENGLNEYAYEVVSIADATGTILCLTSIAWTAETLGANHVAKKATDTAAEIVFGSETWLTTSKDRDWALAGLANTMAYVGSGTPLEVINLIEKEDARISALKEITETAIQKGDANIAKEYLLRLTALVKGRTNEFERMLPHIVQFWLQLNKPEFAEEILHIAEDSYYISDIVRQLVNYHLTKDDTSKALQLCEYESNPCEKAILMILVETRLHKRGLKSPFDCDAVTASFLEYLGISYNKN